MVRPADPRRSRAVLIGTSRYAGEQLPDLPVVSKTVTDLAAALTDPVYGAVSRRNCQVLLDEGDIGLIGRRLRAAAESAEDLLLVFYVGHGLVGARRHELYLALPQSEPSGPEFSALEYDKLRSAVLDSPAAAKVIILDCCFSGRAVTDTMADPLTEIMGQIEVDGTYVLASAARDQVAVIVPGENRTAFTGRLVRLLRDGIPGGPELLTLDNLYEQLVVTMRAAGLPRPYRLATLTAGLLALAPNRAYTAPLKAQSQKPATARPEAPNAPPGSAGPQRRPIRRRERKTSAWGRPAGLILLAVLVISAALGYFILPRPALPGPIQPGTSSDAPASPGPLVSTTSPGSASPASTAFPRVLVAPSAGSPDDTGGVFGLAFSPQGNTLATGYLDGSTYLWNPAVPDKPTGTLPDPGSGNASIQVGVFGVVFNRQGDALATGSNDGNTYVWNPSKRSLSHALHDPGRVDGHINSLAFSPDGGILAVADAGGIYLWNVATGTLSHVLHDPGNLGVYSVAFSRDGKTLAAGDANGSVYLWNPSTWDGTGTLVYPGKLTGPFKAVKDLAFSADGKILVAGDADGGIYLWHLADPRKPFSTLYGPAGGTSITSVVFSPDGADFAVGDTSDTYVWTLASRTLVDTFHDPGTGGVDSVAFSADGKTLAVGDDNGEAYLWPLS